MIDSWKDKLEINKPILSCGSKKYYYNWCEFKIDQTAVLRLPTYFIIIYNQQHYIAEFNYYILKFLFFIIFWRTKNKKFLL